MKYKDFKMLTVEDMKQIIGGNAPAGWCSGTAECRYGGTVTLTCPNSDAGCVASDYGAEGYTGNGSVYCSQNGVLTTNLCPNSAQ
ncbi:MAG TPA: hypothetical protein PLU18_06250 [Ferruginibacter sp.]|nr:hypothetical protein [Ferruginibacter sp.]